MDSRVRYYTGVGSRKTPPEAMKLMTKIAAKLEKDGFHLRSGAAPGADNAFECGVTYLENMSIYIPWKGFPDKVEVPHYIIPKVHRWRKYSKAKEMCLDYHPAPASIKDKPSHELHTRNMFQVLGDDLNTPSEFVILWAPPYKDGVSGGTNIAYQVALDNEIEIFNLFDYKVKKRFEEYVKK